MRIGLDWREKIELALLKTFGVNAMIRSLNVLRRSSLRQPNGLSFPRLMSAAPDRRPFVLADIGEGIAEVELMKWFVVCLRIKVILEKGRQF